MEVLPLKETVVFGCAYVFWFPFASITFIETKSYPLLVVTERFKLLAASASVVYPSGTFCPFTSRKPCFYQTHNLLPLDECQEVVNMIFHVPSSVVEERAYFLNLYLPVVHSVLRPSSHIQFHGCFNFFRHAFMTGIVISGVNTLSTMYTNLSTNSCLKPSF